MKARILTLLLFASFCAFAQKKLDSLVSLLKTDKEDTTKVLHLNAVAGLCYRSGNYDTSLYYSHSAVKLANKINFKKGAAAAYSNIGVVHSSRAENTEALEYYAKALKLDEELGDRSGMGKRLSNMGVVYRNMGNYPKALDHYLRALKIGKELGDKPAIANRLANLGIIYKDQGDYLKALDHYFQALKIDEELGSKYGVAKEYTNIGNVYDEQDDYAKALEYYLKGIKLAEEIEHKSLMTNLYGNIGNVYNQQASVIEPDSAALRNKLQEQALHYYLKCLRLAEEMQEKSRMSIQLGNIGLLYNEQLKTEKSPAKKAELLASALHYFSRARRMSEELGEKYDIARHYGNIGALYVLQKNYKAAYDHLYRALALDDSLGALDYMKTWYAHLSELYERSNIPLPDSIGGKVLNPEQMRLRALYYHKRYIALRDILFSEENKKQLVRKEMNYEFEKKEASTRAEQEKKDAVAAEEKKRQFFVLILVSFVLLLVAVIAIVIFRSLRTTRKQKIEIENQKHLVEEKQKEILDSIHYAKRIQTALITNENYINKNLTRLQKN